MNEDEKRVFSEMVNMRVETDSRIEKLMRYILVAFCFMIVFSFTSIVISVVSSNNAVKSIEKLHSETISSIEQENSDTIQELWRTYFETDYLYPDQSINQNVKVGE